MSVFHAAAHPANKITITQTVVSVGTTDTVLVAANPSRKYLALCVIGTTGVSLAFNQVATLNSGWPLAPASALGTQGGQFVWESTGITTDAIHAISSAATTVVVMEGV